MKLRFGKLLIVPIVAMAMAGGTYAAIGTHSGVAPSSGDTPAVDVSPTASPDASPAPDSTLRFHGDATSCAVPAGTTLTGNWTHGDLVSAWARSGDRTKTLAAAHSDCGKPTSAIAHKTKRRNANATESPSATVDENKQNEGKNEVDAAEDGQNDQADEADANDGQDTADATDEQGDHQNGAQDGAGNDSASNGNNDHSENGHD